MRHMLQRSIKKGRRQVKGFKRCGSCGVVSKKDVHGDNFPVLWPKEKEMSVYVFGAGVFLIALLILLGYMGVFSHA